MSNRSQIKAYLDTVVVSAMHQSHQSADENAAIKSLVDLFRSGRIHLVKSKAVDDEVERTPRPETRTRIQKWNDLFTDVPFVDDTKLVGFLPAMSGPRPWLSGTVNPVHEDNADSRRLREVGIGRSDAQHILIALRSACDVFVTCDKRTILKRRAVVEKQFPIRLLLPTELLAELEGD